jgi:sugar/nucleoside kinase (ribokinase family)
LTVYIDEIDYITGRSKAKLLGGAGTYVAVGSRLVAGRANAKHVGWIVDQGSDFPDAFAATIDSWGTSVIYRSDSARLTTRAWNGYGPGEHRDFKYLTPKIRLDQDSLSDTQLASKAFHMVCSSERCISLAEGLERRRRRQNCIALPRPRLVWEPVPELCVPSELEKFKCAMKVVDIVSPNSEELADFFIASKGIQAQSEMADWVLGSGIGVDGTGALVVREGSEGASVYTRKWSIHLPAYHTLASMVKDPTGGGNAYLGGLMMAMGRKVEPDMDIVETTLKHVIDPAQSSDPSASTLICAAIYATIAASYVIEQAGMPLLSASGGAETWNGETFGSRLAKYVTREKDHIAKSLQIR